MKEQAGLSNSPAEPRLTDTEDGLWCLNDQGGDRMDCISEKAATLRAQMGSHQPIVCLNDQGGNIIECSYEVSGTLRAQEHGHQPVVIDVHARDSRYTPSTGAVQTVRAAFGAGGGNTPLVLKTGQGADKGPALYENHGIDARYTGPHRVAPTMSARYGTGGNNVPLVDQSLCMFSRQRVDVFREDHVTCTESARQHKDATDLIYQAAVNKESDMTADKCGNTRPRLIRRLTPVECERLQGFPDNWTNIPGAADSARYKALGNSVAIPCVDFIMSKIAGVLRSSRI